MTTADTATTDLQSLIAELLDACEAAYFLPDVWINDPSGEVAKAVKAEVKEQLRAIISKTRAIYKEIP